MGNGLGGLLPNPDVSQRADGPLRLQMTDAQGNLLAELDMPMVGDKVDSVKTIDVIQQVVDGEDARLVLCSAVSKTRAMIAAIKAYDVDSVDDQKEQEHQATWAGEHVRVVSEVERFELPLNTPTLVSRGIILTYIRTDNSVELKPLVEAERVETTTTTEFTLSQLVGFKELKFNTGAGASVGQSFVFVKGLMTGPATSVVVANALGVQQRELPLTEHLTETVSGGPACRFMDCGRTRGGEKLSVVFGAEHYVLRADAARLTAPDFNAQIDLQTVRLEGEIAHVSIGPMGVVAVPDRSLKNPFIGAILLLDTESLRIVEQIQVPQLETFSNLVPYHVCQISATTGFMTFNESTGNKARSLHWHDALFDLVK